MLKKLLTGCLTIAMIGAFSASAVAETTFTWTGDVTGNLIQTTTKDGTSDAKSISNIDMSASADLDLAVVKSGDAWTGTAKMELDWTNHAVSVDDLYVTMANDQLAIMIGANDIVGISQGRKYLGEIDDTYGADNRLFTPGEDGWLQLSLKEVGLDLFIGMNKTGDNNGRYSYSAIGYGAVIVEAKNVLDATSNNKDYASTAYGLTFKKTISIVDIGFQYVTLGTTIDKNVSTDGTKDGALDGASANELLLAVTANFNEQMALTLNYTSSTAKAGTSGAKTQEMQTTELAFDYGISDTMGLSAVYGMLEYKTGQSGKGNKLTGSELNLTFKMMTDGIDHYIAYQSRTLISDQSSAKEASETKMGYSMRVAF